jgi:DNA-binding CsgD family transcriptional regulator
MIFVSAIANQAKIAKVKSSKKNSFFCLMTKIVLRFGMLSLAFLLLTQLSQYTWLSYKMNSEMIILLLAISFIGFGAIAGRMAFQKKDGLPGGPFELDEKKLNKLGISNRELEVLQFMAEGRSNKEIGEALFISENTIKTHVSNLLIKLEAKRRTEAIKIAKEKSLIP